MPSIIASSTPFAQIVDSQTNYAHKQNNTYYIGSTRVSVLFGQNIANPLLLILQTIPGY